MAQVALIEQELASAEAAWKEANEGKARVCARRAVALATEAWLAGFPARRWHGDAMEHLRRLQQDPSLPLPVRQAAERLSTSVARRRAAAFTINPMNDARLIVAHLQSNMSERAP